MFWCHPIYWYWSTGFFQYSHFTKKLEHFMLPSADKLCGIADLVTCNCISPVKGIKSYFNDFGVTVLDRPDNSSDLHLKENLWSAFKKKLGETRTINANDLKGANNTTLLIFFIKKWFNRNTITWANRFTLHFIFVRNTNDNNKDFWKIPAGWYHLFRLWHTYAQ